MRELEYCALDVRVLAVAKRGAVGDWSAYVGAVEGKIHSEEAAEVVAKGTKLPRGIAELLFPGWKTLDWRE